MKRLSPELREQEYQSLRRLLREAAKGSSRLGRFARALEYELSPCQKKYIHLYYLRQMTMPDIARLHGVHPSTVSRTIQRGLARLEHAMRFEFSQSLQKRCRFAVLLEQASQYFPDEED